MQTALQQIRLFCFILALSCQYQHLWARCALVFQYKGQTQFMIDDSGNMLDARIIQNAADATPDEALIFEKNHQLMLWAHDNHVFIPGALHEYTDTAAYPNTGLQFKTNQLGHAAELTDAGDLYISGKETVRQPTAMITYVDNSAVYELNADKVNELQYHHLGTPLGTEGRIFADNRTESYVKDHLGSVRSVIAERPNGQGYEVLEYTSYYHYGSIKDALERPGQVREKFTGKELDEDGQGNGSPGLQLYYFGARFYDPVVGVWLSVDKAEQFFSPYAYAGNGANPVVMVDADGNFIFTTGFLVAAGIAAVAGGVTGGVIAAKTDQNIFAGIGIGMGIGLVSAFTGGAAAAGMSAATAGAAAAGGWAAFGGAVATGAVSGAAGGFVSGFANSWAFGGLAQNGSFFSGDGMEALAAGGKGALIGGIVGGASEAALFGVSRLAERVGSNMAGDILQQGDDLSVDFDPSFVKTDAGNELSLANIKFSGQRTDLAAVNKTLSAFKQTAPDWVKGASVKASGAVRLTAGGVKVANATFSGAAKLSKSFQATGFAAKALKFFNLPSAATVNATVNANASIQGARILFQLTTRDILYGGIIPSVTNGAY